MTLDDVWRAAKVHQRLLALGLVLGLIAGALVGVLTPQQWSSSVALVLQVVDDQEGLDYGAATVYVRSRGATYAELAMSAPVAAELAEAADLPSDSVSVSAGVRADYVIDVTVTAPEPASAAEAASASVLVVTRRVQELEAPTRAPVTLAVLEPPSAPQRTSLRAALVSPLTGALGLCLALAGAVLLSRLSGTRDGRGSHDEFTNHDE